MEKYKEFSELIKEMQGVILNELETQDLYNFDDDEIWEKYPYPATASDFLKTNALTKHAGCRICVGIKNNRFEILKNINDQTTLNWSGSEKELYELLNNNRRWIKPKEKIPKTFIVAGKYKEHYVIIRCCNEGDWYITPIGNGSGAWHCEHTGWHGFWDYMDPTSMKEVTDKKIIDQVKQTDGYKLYMDKWKNRQD